MTLYNEPWEWAKEAIDSVLDQSLEDIEVNIVIDRPDYPHEATLREYTAPDHRLSIRALEANGGPAVSANAALGMATAPLVVIMDGDDKARPYGLERQVNYMEQNPAIDLCCGWIETFGAKTGEAWTPSAEDIYAKMCLGSPLFRPGMMMRSRVLEAYDEFFKKEYNYAEDYEAWVRVGRQFRFGVVPTVIIDYRISDQQVTNVKQDIMADQTKRIRLMAVNNYLEANGIHATISAPLSIEDLETVGALQPVMPKEYFSNLVYRMFRSIPGVGIKELGRLLRMGYLGSLALKYQLKILFVALNRGYWKQDF